jgi:predicted ATPase
MSETNTIGYYAAVFHQLLRDVQAAREQAEAAITLAKEQGFPFFVADGAILRGWALAEQGQGEEGIAEMRQGLGAHGATGTEAARTYFLAQLTEAYRKVEQFEEGLYILAEASSLVVKNEERVYDAELHRLKGELLSLSSDNLDEAESYFQQALTIARRQQAKSWELRAATSLARLWQQQGKRQEAHDLLAPIYNWFTEGFDTADLQDAKALLDQLT